LHLPALQRRHKCLLSSGPTTCDSHSMHPCAAAGETEVDAKSCKTKKGQVYKKQSYEAKVGCPAIE
jgi:hypothetical protein